MWVYHSPIGPIFIKKSYDSYQLIYNEVCYGNYPSAIAAADDVYTFSTGCDEWDSLSDSADPPTDIYEWDHC